MKRKRSALKPRSVGVLPVLAAAIALVAAPASAASGSTPLAWQQPQQTGELTLQHAHAGDLLGVSVAVTLKGTIAVVGACGRSGDTGAVFVYKNGKSGWKQAAQLTASDPVRDNEFGLSVAVSQSGSTIAIGAPGNNKETGAVYVFSKTGKKWTQTAELTAADAAKQADFGFSVALSGDGATLVVGSPDEDNDKPTPPPGSAYVFTQSGGSWSQTAELTSSDGAPHDWFGAATAISSDGSTVAVASPSHDGDVGAGYVFGDAGGTWAQSAEVTAPDGAAGDQFGASLALSADGSDLAVGSPGSSSFTGAAYVFDDTAGSWTQTAELTPTDEGHDRFGYAVSMSGAGTTLAVGAPFAASAAGATDVYVAKAGDWTQQATLSASDAAADDQFGSAVALSGKGTAALVGAYERQSGAGAAYAYSGSSK